MVQVLYTVTVHVDMRGGCCWLRSVQGQCRMGQCDVFVCTVACRGVRWCAVICRGVLWHAVP